MRSVDLKTASHGRFEVSLDGEPVFSKATEGRLPAPGEVSKLMEAKLGPPLPWRKSST